MLLYYTYRSIGETSALSGLPKKGSPCHVRTSYRCAFFHVPRAPANNPGDSGPAGRTQRKKGYKKSPCNRPTVRNGTGAKADP